MNTTTIPLRRRADFFSPLEARRLFAVVPDGFGLTLVTTSLVEPTAMAALPNGNILVTEQGGNLRLVGTNGPQSAPVLSVTADNSGERGLLGVAVDPSFATNGYVYLYYTALAPKIHNRLSRFTLQTSPSGLTASAASEKVLLDLPNLSSATNHNGGAVHFAPDGTLYVAVGENGNGDNSPSLNTPFGKMLRINPDGSIPTDNPFYTQTTGINRAIYARGLRNPFTFAFSASGTLLINDVGQSSVEEVNRGQAGANYGWPSTEGPTTATGITGPIYSYTHDVGQAIAGATFDASGAYYFGDYVAGFVKKLDPATGRASPFATGFDQPVDLLAQADGSLVVLTRSPALYRITPATGAAPVINTQPAAVTTRSGKTATFTVSASGDNLVYQWTRNGEVIPGASSTTYTTAPLTNSDNGALFRCVVTNGGGTTRSEPAKLTIDNNRPPVPAIVSPASGTKYAAGQRLALQFAATDPDQASLPDSAFSYRVVFHHDTHTHPFIATVRGKRSAVITIPNTGESATNVFYRVELTVTDKKGATVTVTRDLRPRVSRLRVSANAPVATAGGLTRDGVPVSSTLPTTVTVVEGFKSRFEAPTSFVSGGFRYTLVGFNTGTSVKRGVISLVTPPGTTNLVVTYKKTNA